MAAVLGRRRLVLLGEHSHGDGVGFAIKSRLTRFLHRRHGFDVVAFEAGIFDAASAMRARGAAGAMLASGHGAALVDFTGIPDDEGALHRCECRLKGYRREVIEPRRHLDGLIVVREMGPAVERADGTTRA